MSAPKIAARLASGLAALIFASVAGSAAAAAAPAKAAAPFASETIRISRQHPRIILAPRRSRTGTIRIQFRAGAYDDGFRSGLTRLTQQAMIGSNGVEPYERFATDLFGANASLEIETGVRESAFVLTAPARDFPGLAKRLATMTLAPRIVDAKLDDAKSRTLQQPGNASFGVLAAMLARSIFSDAAYGNDPHGDKDAIRTMSLGDVRRHLAGPMAPANATVVVAGAFDPRDLKAFLSRFKGGTLRDRQRPKGELAGNYHQRSYLEFHMLALPVTLESARSVAATHLLGAVLEERILRQFRRLGIAYGAWTTPLHREWLDAVLIALPINSDGEISVGSQLAREIAEVRAGTFQRDELERNRAHLLIRFRDIDRDSASLASALAVGAGDLEWFGPRVAAEVAKMTPEEFIAAVSPWLDPAASIHVQLSPRSAASQERGSK